MRLKSLQLYNICQHRHLEWRFDSGLIAILGRNGSGKSNALNSLYAGLTGKFSRHSRGKQGYIRQAADPGEESKIVIEAEHGGTSFTMVRSLRPDSRCLTIDGRELTKEADIGEALFEQLKLTPKLLDTYVFVGQWRMFDFIGTDTDRATQLMRLCGTEKAETCWDLLGRQLDTDRVLGGSVIDNSDELRLQLADYQRRCAAMEETLTLRKADVLPPAEAQLLTEQLAQGKRLERLRGELPALREQEAAALAKAKQDVATCRVQQDKVSQLEVKLAELRDAAEKAREADANYREQEKLWRRRQACELALSGLAPPVEVPEGPPAEMIQALQREIRDAERLMDRHQDIVDAWENAAACPTCGTPVEKTSIDVAASRKILDQQRAIVNAAGDKLQKANKAAAARRAYEKALESYEGQKALYTAQMAGAENAVCPTRPDTSAIAACRQLETTLDQARREVAELARVKEAAKGAHQALKARVASAEAEIASLHGTDDVQLREAAKRLATSQAAATEVAQLSAQVSTLRRVAEDVEKQLTALQERLQRSAKLKGWVKALERARSIVHRENLPAQVHRRRMEEIVERCNDTLDLFGRPFTVTATDNLDMTAHFVDGTVTHSGDLSGGQKMVLALAYRLAVNSLFARQIGLLVLDEPTASVDGQYVDQMTDVFADLGRAAKASGQQIIVVTHEERLQQVFDQVIRLD